MNRSFSWINTVSLLLLLSSALLWSGIFFAGAEEASDSAQSYCDGYRYNGAQLFEDLLEEASLNTNIQIADIFGGSSQKPEIENLYLNVYKLMDQAPSDAALQNTAAEYQYTQEEMCAILGGGLYFLTDTEDKTLSVTDLQEMRSEILKTYERELEKAKLEQEMFMDSYSKEIFVNGDTADSSFDVLYDLEVIEYLLFGESTYTTTGGGDLDYSSEEDADTDSTEAEESDSSDTPDSESTTSSSSGSTDTDSTEEESESAEDSPEAEEEESSVNPASCAAESALQATLSDALGSEDPDTESSGGEDESDGSEDPDSGEEGSDETRDAGSATSTSDPDAEDDDLVIASTPHDWTQPDLCNDIFCLFVNFINEDETDYETSDNCIQCHVDYIVEALKDTTGKDLTPGKVSGNLLEPAVCKRSLVEKLTRPAGLSFIAIPMPIQTPPADDIVTGLNFCEKNRDFLDSEENYAFLLSSIFKETCTEEAAASELSEEQNARLQEFGEDLNQEIKAADTRTYGAASVQDLLGEAISAHEVNQRAVEAAFQNSYTEARFSDQATFYQLMDQEMSQMNDYFQLFQDLIVNTQVIAEELKNNLKDAS